MYREDLGELPEVLGGGGEVEFVVCATWAAQSKPVQTENPLQVREQHLDLLSELARDCILRRSSNRPGHIAGWLVDRPCHLTRRFFRTAARFQSTAIAIGLAGPVTEHAIFILFLLSGLCKCPAGLLQFLAAWTGVDILLSIIGEISPLECVVLAPRFVDHRNMRRDPALLNKPVEHFALAVSGVRDQAFRLDAEGIADAVDHRPHRSNLGLADRTVGLHVEDHAVVGVDQIIGGVGKTGGGRLGPRSIAMPDLNVR